MKSDKLISELSRDWEWLSFVTQYCAGKNFGKPLCEDFMWWALAAAALAVALVAWWIFGKLARVYGNWKHRKMLAEVADAETMKEHVWSGHAMHDEQRAAKSRRPEKS